MIMGRLFEYNRLNNSEDIKKDVGVADSKQKVKSQSPQTKPKPKKYETPVCPSYSELYPNNDIQLKEDTTKSTKSTSKSVEIAIKKYHQLSKFLVHNQDDEKDDCGMIASAVTPKKPKVYDCMRDFLRKKLFQHTISEESESVEYDEDDFLAEIDPFDIDEEDDDECLLVISSNHQSRTKYTQIVENECWSSTKVFAKEEHDVDSDAGIKDCCQLLSGSNSPKTDKSFKSPKRKPMEVPIELRDASWFQPNITSKAATERLTKESSGAFIIRQSSTVKAGNFILCLRMETKVKKFVILGSPRCYKIKGAKKEFSSLKALVTHHSVMAEQLPVTLALPRPIEEKSSHRYLDDFDTFESLQILGILKFLQAKNLEFS